MDTEPDLVAAIDVAADSDVIVLARRDGEGWRIAAGDPAPHIRTAIETITARIAARTRDNCPTSPCPVHDQRGDWQAWLSQIHRARLRTSPLNLTDDQRTQILTALSDRIGEEAGRWTAKS